MALSERNLKYGDRLYYSNPNGGKLGQRLTGRRLIYLGADWGRTVKALVAPEEGLTNVRGYWRAKDRQIGMQTELVGFSSLTKELPAFGSRALASLLVQGKINKTAVLAAIKKDKKNVGTNSKAKAR